MERGGSLTLARATRGEARGRGARGKRGRGKRTPCQARVGVLGLTCTKCARPSEKEGLRLLLRGIALPESFGAVAIAPAPRSAPRSTKNQAEAIPSGRHLSRRSRRCERGSKSASPKRLFIYKRHVTSFFSTLSAFAHGIGGALPKSSRRRWRTAQTQTQCGAPPLAQPSASRLVADEFDMSLFQKGQLENGASRRSRCFARKRRTWPSERLVHRLRGGDTLDRLNVGATMLQARSGLRRAIEKL